MASSGTADHNDLKSLSLPGAIPGAPTTACGSTGIADRFGSNPNSLGSAILPMPTNFWNVHQTSVLGLGANERARFLREWCKPTAFRHELLDDGLDQRTQLLSAYRDQFVLRAKE